MKTELSSCSLVVTVYTGTVTVSYNQNQQGLMDPDPAIFIIDLQSNF
jgi:hypothetical protein